MSSKRQMVGRSACIYSTVFWDWLFCVRIDVRFGPDEGLLSVLTASSGKFASLVPMCSLAPVLRCCLTTSVSSIIPFWCLYCQSKGFFSDFWSCASRSSLRALDYSVTSSDSTGTLYRSAHHIMVELTWKSQSSPRQACLQAVMYLHDEVHPPRTEEGREPNFVSSAVTSTGMSYSCRFYRYRAQQWVIIVGSWPASGIFLTASLLFFRRE